MVAVAVWIGSIGVGDLIAGLDGSVHSRGRAVVSGAAGASVAIAGGVLVGLPAASTLVLLAITVITQAAWLWARLPATWSEKRSVAILVGQGLALSTMLALSGSWPDVTSSSVEEWLRSLPFESIIEVSAEEFTVFVAVLSFLQSTANATVRLVLRVAGNPPRSEQDLRGGRIIGPLERTIIFSLSMAGQPTAAALVVSAKGLLRFPELSQEDKSRIHAVTEYFLIGSLTSWLLALAVAGLTLL